LPLTLKGSLLMVSGTERVARPTLVEPTVALARQDRPVPPGSRVSSASELMDLQRAVGNAAVVAMLGRPTRTNSAADERTPVVARDARAARSAARSSSPSSATVVLQRKIKVGAAELTTDQALDRVKDEFPDEVILRQALKIFDSGNETFTDDAEFRNELRTAVGFLSAHDPKTIDENTWMVLHRLKAQSFTRFIQARYGEKVDPEQMKRAYEHTGARYAPPGGKHTWDTNLKWLEDVVTVKKLTKVVLTDIPLTRDNIYRTGKLAKEFSAYAREIANMLYEDYVPIGSSTMPGMVPVGTVTMVSSRALPLRLIASILKTIKVNKQTALHIIKDMHEAKVDKHGDDVMSLYTLVSPTAAETFFADAGLPVARREVAAVVKKEVSPDEQIRYLAARCRERGAGQLPGTKAEARALILDDAKQGFADSEAARLFLDEKSMQPWGGPRMLLFIQNNGAAIEEAIK
jgi:hypothetical protein